MQYDASSASTLGALEPEFALTLNWRRPRFSPRNQGGLVQNLRTPSRLPDVHRAYTSGDPASRIDWRAYARTDELLIREVQEDAAARIHIFLECHPSMFWPSDAEKAALPRATISKWEVAVRVAFHLAFIHVKQGDFIHLILVDGQGESSLSKVPLRDQSAVSSFFIMMKDLFFNEEARNTLFGMSEMVMGSLPACDAHYVIGDFLNTEPQSEGLFHTLPNPIGLHVLNQFEVNTDWFKDDVSYFDQEASSKTDLPGKFLLQQQRYATSLQEWWTTWQRDFELRGGLYTRLTDATRIIDFHNTLKQLRQVVA